MGLMHIWWSAFSFCFDIPLSIVVACHAERVYNLSKLPISFKL